MSQSQTPLKENAFDSPDHKKLFETGLEVRKKVVGEDYVANSLEKGGSDFLRPLQQYATVSLIFSFPLIISQTPLPKGFPSSSFCMFSKVVMLMRLGRVGERLGILVDETRTGTSWSKSLGFGNVDSFGQVDWVWYSYSRGSQEWFDGDWDSRGAVAIEVSEAILSSFLFWVHKTPWISSTDWCYYFSAYCGLPAAFEAFRVADRVLNEMEERGEIKREK